MWNVLVYRFRCKGGCFQALSNVDSGLHLPASIRPVCGLSLVLAAPLPVVPAATPDSRGGLWQATACRCSATWSWVQWLRLQGPRGRRTTACSVWQASACLPWFWSWLRPGNTEAPALWPGLVWRLPTCPGALSLLRPRRRTGSRSVGTSRGLRRFQGHCGLSRSVREHGVQVSRP